MRDAHGGFGLVDVLAASAAGAIGVDLEILVVDLDGGVVFNLRHDFHCGKRGVASAGCVEWRNAHHAVHAFFALQIAVGVFAFDEHGHALDAGFVAVEIVEHLDLVAVALCPAHIHAIEHLCPVLAFGAASAWMDRKDGVVVVVVAV